MGDILAEVLEELDSWDIPATRNNIIRVVSNWINNLESHIGYEAHMHSSLYVTDNTGMSWEEQDEATLKQINEYKKFLCSLE